MSGSTHDVCGDHSRDESASGRPAPAPTWHTALLVSLYVCVAIAGVVLHGRIGAPAPASQATERITAIYAPLIVVQLALALYVCRIGRGRWALSAMIGRRWTSGRRLVADLALAAAAWLFIVTIELASHRLFASSTAASVTAMLPRSSSERGVWVIAAVVVGCCEEIVFRGYFLAQFTALTGRAKLAIVAQAALFALAHAEQGAAAMVRIAIYGLAFGAIAHRRQSLLPGIACHVATDLASGLLPP